MRTAAAIPIQPAPENPARAALRAAIAHKHTAERELEAAKNAVESARDRLWDAQAELEKIENPDLQDGDDESEPAPASPDIGARFSEALQAGREVDLDELDRDDEQEKISKAKRQIDVWRKTVRSCEAAVPAKDEAVRLATEEIDKAAAEVIRSAAGDGIVESLIAGLEEMQAIVFMRRLQLHFLASKQLIPENERERVMAVLAPLSLPAGPSDVYFHEWHQHPAWLAWERAHAALRGGDASAPLPADDGL